MSEWFRAEPGDPLGPLIRTELMRIQIEKNQAADAELFNFLRGEAQAFARDFQRMRRANRRREEPQPIRVGGPVVD